MAEDLLARKLREIERGFGEEGADAARAALARWRVREADIEFRVSVPSPTAQRVLLGWCLRYGLTAYRTPRQRKTTMCVRVPRGFMHEVMWPRVDTMAESAEWFPYGRVAVQCGDTFTWIRGEPGDLHTLPSGTKLVEKIPRG